MSKSSHSYLSGERKTFEPEAIITAPNEAFHLLPVVQLPGVVLFPSTQVPIRLLRPDILGLVDQLLSTRQERSPLANAIHLRSRWENVAHIIKGTRTLGIVNNIDHVGCIVEILWVGQDTEGWYCVGKGIGRFQIVQTSSKTPPLSNIRHIQDIVPQNIPRAAFDNGLHSSSRSRSSSHSHSHSHSRSAQLSRWPRFVYNLFDPTILSSRLLECLKNSGLELDIPSSIIPTTDPLKFTYWVCDNLPLSTKDRQLLMDTPTFLLRVQLLIRMLTNDIGTLNCVNCQQTIAHPKHAFSLLDTNIIGTFVNPSGAVMQVATFEKVENENAILCIGECVTEHSWFQGYGWTMTCCSQCHTHLGWRFDASPQPLLPSRFYGFRSECLIRGTTALVRHVDGNNNNNTNNVNGEEEKELENDEEGRGIVGTGLLRAWWAAARQRLLEELTDANEDNEEMEMEENVSVDGDDDAIDDDDDV